MWHMSNPTTQTNSIYGAYLPKWKRMRDAVSGRDAVLEHDLAEFNRPDGTRLSYLPPLTGQSLDEYRAYQNRATWFGATDRTINGLAGLIFSKDPDVKIHAAIEKYKEDIDLGGTSLRDFAQRLCFEELTTGRVAVMVEFPSIDTSGMTQAQAELSNARPYLTYWNAEHIVDWRVGSVPQQGNRLTFVKLKETVVEYGDDLSPAKYVTQYRVLDLIDGKYRQRVWREAGKDEWVLAQEIYPSSNGKIISYIPFHIVGGVDVRKPLLLDLADTNIAHYKVDADMSHALHLSALPTAWVSGVQLEPNQSLSIGGSTAWVFPDPQAKAGFLEFTGQGLAPLQSRLDKLQENMAILGARILQSGDKATNETFGGAELRTAGERGTLAAVARDVSEAVTQALMWMSEWMNVSGEIRFGLNNDYGAHRMDAQMMTALLGAYQSGAMPLSVLFMNLKRGDIAPQEMTIEEYQAGIDMAGPTLENAV